MPIRRKPSEVMEVDWAGTTLKINDHSTGETLPAYDFIGAVRRFQKRYRNALWHSNIKYGPYLPIGPNGTKKQVYMVAFLDDATRFALHVAFYPMLDARCVVLKMLFVKLSESTVFLKVFNLIAVSSTARNGWPELVPS
ncbi:hypothetical protein [Bacillus sp. P14.5]|uniref:hypothetical protein n=1 Tax=Bacillus sp. P14.5 TaxID=1983400 RepID=UPI0013B05A2C|nr:hypothetical protein [Bacillus sp. P14.5]